MSCTAWVVLGVVAFVLLAIAGTVQANKQAELRQDYEEKLRRFSAAPTDQTLKRLATNSGLTFVASLALTPQAIEKARETHPDGTYVPEDVHKAVSRIEQVHKHKTLELEYQELLKALRTDPTNAETHTKALSKGRELAGLGRKLADAGGNVTVYDEMALMNDLNAATAASGRIRASANETPVASEAKNKPSSALSCPVCGSSQEGELDISPSGDLKCEGCGKWFNIRS